eukprot:757809-Hanusia_phi.AAC.4
MVVSPALVQGYVPRAPHAGLRARSLSFQPDAVFSAIPGQTNRVGQKKRVSLQAASTAIPAITWKGFILLSSCIACGVSGATSMKLSNGFKNFWPSVMIFVSYALAFVLFTKALMVWPLSIAYAVWSGLGTAATAVIGVAFFKERVKHGSACSTSLHLLLRRRLIVYPPSGFQVENERPSCLQDTLMKWQTGFGVT